MTTLTQPLHDEHRELFPHVERILEVANAITTGNLPGIYSDLEELDEFLAHHLLAHARAEEAALYPAVEQALGSPDVTRTMRRDHVEIARYVDELETLTTGAQSESLTGAQAADLRRVLYGTYALLKVHFAKEEEVYLPVLDRYLTPETARAMFEKMEETAAKAKESV